MYQIPFSHWLVFFPFHLRRCDVTLHDCKRTCNLLYTSAVTKIITIKIDLVKEIEIKKFYLMEKLKGIENFWKMGLQEKKFSKNFLDNWYFPGDCSEFQ